MSNKIRFAAIAVAGALALTAVVAAGTAKHHTRSVHVNSPEVYSRTSVERVLGQPKAPNVYAQPTTQTKPLQRRGSALEVIMENFDAGVMVLIVHTVAKHPKEVIQLIKNGVFWITKGRGQIAATPSDGTCIADWHWFQYDSEHGCSDRTGIFWEYNNSNGRLYNTYTGGDMFAWGTNNGRHTSTKYPPYDWHTWTWGYICANSSCSQVYGTYWPLYNHQSSMLSDGYKP